MIDFSETEQDISKAAHFRFNHWFLRWLLVMHHFFRKCFSANF